MRRPLALLLAVLALSGCGDDSPAPDAAAVDAAAVPDGDLGPDAADAPDAGAPDAAPAACTAEEAAERHGRAEQALHGWLLDFWRGDAGYLRDHTGGPELAGYWIYAQAFDVLLDGVARTGGTRYRDLIDTFAAGQAEHGWSSDYYDDENWLALALLRAYDITGDAAHLDRAVALYADIMAAWDTSCCGPNPGGIWWNRAHTQKATASNGGPVITAVRLAERTGNPDYLAFAIQVYDYWMAEMIDPDTGQVADHIDPDGAITRWRFTYNEGVMIGAGVALHGATGEARYLDDARARAAFMVAHESAASTAGPVLTDGACGGDCQQFKGIGYRYLAELDALAPDPEVGALLRSSAEAVWSLARDPATGHFGVDWSGGPPSGSVSLAQQSSALMALALDALHCGAAPAAAATRFEAEEGALAHVGLEASAAGFTGWAYLAGWNGDGQGVTLRITAPAAGAYRLRFHYAGGAGDATRRITLDGAALAPAFTFPGTAGWDSYASVDLPATLPAGTSRVGIHFAAGSASYLNLDAVELLPP